MDDLDGGPAFPSLEYPECVRLFPGMSLRDYFAAAIAKGAAANPNIAESKTDRALWAYEVADELMRIRKLSPGDIGKEIKASSNRFVI